MSINRFAGLALLAGTLALGGCMVDTGGEDESTLRFDEITFELLEVEEGGEDFETETTGRHRDSEDDSDDDVVDKPDQKMDPVPDPWEGGNGDGNND